MPVIEIGPYQDKLLRQSIYANLFCGGSKRSAKSYGGALLTVQHCELFGADANCLVIRATYDGAKELKAMFMEILGKKFDCDARKFWSGDAKTFVLPSKARIEVGFLQQTDDLLRYRGRGPSFLLLDEIADLIPKLVNQLRSELSGRKGVVCRIVATANPARPFHSVYAPYARQEPWKPFLEPDTGLIWINCPGNIWENPFINVQEAIDNMRKDPNFIALSTGDWDAVNANNFFKGAWANHRVIVDDWTHLPEFGWKYSVYCDHGGGTSPTAAIFSATALEYSRGGDGTFFPKGSVVVFDYHDDSLGQESGNWNVVADGWSIKRNCEEMVKIADGWNMKVRGKIDNQVDQDHGDEHTLLHQYHKNGCPFEKWSKPRLENAAAVVREYLIHAEKPDERKRPGLYIANSCRGLIETIPNLPTHRSNPDAPETRYVPDHGYDCVKALTWDRSLEWKQSELVRGVNYG